MSIPNQRIVYLNGDYLPENEARLPFRDRGVKYGDAVFDTTRTFNHEIFKLREHLERLYRSLRYIGIDPGLALEEMAAITEEVVKRNLPLIAEDEDYWVSQRITRGITDPNERSAWPDYVGPTVIVDYAATAGGARETLPRWHRRGRAGNPPHGPGYDQPARENA